MMDVYLVLSSGKRVVSRVPAGNLAEGKSISARVNPAEIHLFELTTAADPYGQSLRGDGAVGVNLAPPLAAGVNFQRRGTSPAAK